MTILLAGGGTGGHVFPMMAVADALQALAPEREAVFVGTERGIERQVVPQHGYRLELLEVDPIRGGGLRGMLKGVTRAVACMPVAIRLVEDLQPSVVFSVGGYAAGPISVAARLLGIPLALLEPNAVIGLANAITAPLVQRAYTAFVEAEGAFPPSRVRRIGVPIRDGFQPRDYRLQSRPRRVLVLGGSQGAKALNETVPEALASCASKVSIVHQCGPKHLEATRARYERLSAECSVEIAAFIEDMPGAIESADLVVGRAGASAVSEICAIGRPSLLVPFPFATGDHQRRNAEALQSVQASICVPALEATPSRLAAEFRALLGDERRLHAMARAARSFGRPDAARRIARDLLMLSMGQRSLPFPERGDALTAEPQFGGVQ